MNNEPSFKIKMMDQFSEEQSFAAKKLAEVDTLFAKQRWGYYAIMFTIVTLAVPVSKTSSAGQNKRNPVC